MEALDYQLVELETKSLSDEDRSDIKQLRQLKQLDLNEISKPLSINIKTIMHQFAKKRFSLINKRCCW